MDTKRKMGAWSAEELAILRQYFPVGGSTACLPHLPGRSRDQINDKAAYDHIRCNRRPTPSGAWSDAEVAYLMRNAGRLNHSEIAANLGRTAAAVRVKFHAMGGRMRDEHAPDESLSAHRDHDDWDIEEIDFLRANPGVHASRLARHLRRSRAVVAEMRDRVRRQELAGYYGELDTRYALPIAPDDESRPEPPGPTDAQPGTAEKIRVMAARVVAGYRPHHPADVRSAASFRDIAWSRTTPGYHRFLSPGRVSI